MPALFVRRPPVKARDYFASNSASGSTTRTYVVTLAAAAAARTHVVVGFIGRGASAPTASAVTANGRPLEKVLRQANGANAVEMWFGPDNSGGTGLTIVVTYDVDPVNAYGMAGAALFAPQGLARTTTPGADTTDPLATNVDVLAGGFAAYIAASSNSGAPFTPSGVTERTDTTCGGTFGSLTEYTFGADTFFASRSGLSLGADDSGTPADPCFVGASFR